MSTKCFPDHEWMQNAFALFATIPQSDIILIKFELEESSNQF